jgi:hypothetical protein
MLPPPQQAGVRRESWHAGATPQREVPGASLPAAPPHVAPARLSGARA